MEIKKIDNDAGFQDSKAVKRVPIITDQLVATVLIIDSDSNIPPHTHKMVDEMYYVIKGDGRITIDTNSSAITRGMLILVPRGESHSFSTSDQQMIVLSIGLVSEPEKIITRDALVSKPRKKRKEVKINDRTERSASNSRLETGKARARD
jgi:mannose-6-phosphate isomerase-like protein (cupin superfamily)